MVFNLSGFGGGGSRGVEREDFDFEVRMRAFTLRETFRAKKTITTWNRIGDHKDESDDENH